MTPEQEQAVKLRLDYAWQWFSYHAGQRFAAFNFFLIVAGAVIVAYTAAIGNHKSPLGIGAALLGASMGVGFLMLDYRNAQLVEVARSQLEELEKTSLHFKITTTAHEQRKRGRTHTFWLRGMIIVFIATAGCGAGWALEDFGHSAISGTSQSSSKTQSSTGSTDPVNVSETPDLGI